MEQQVVFADYMEQQAQDHRDIQTHVRASLDHLVYDTVTKSRAFAGFTVIKSAQTEIQVAPGRLYDPDGAVYHRDSVVTQSMLTWLAGADKRWITVVASGVENLTNPQERDFLVDVTTGRTEPQQVSMTKSRDAVISFVQGVESADPQPPAVPSGSVGIANILLDTLQVVSVTMLPNKVPCAEDIDFRLDVVEAFNAKIGPRVDALASDLASLQNRVNNLGTNRDLQTVKEDLARVKEAVRYPVTASDYGADFYLTTTQSDIANAASLGYDARLEEGVRFADANADEFEIALFSNNDPNAKVTNGVLLPAYTDELKLSTWNGEVQSDLGIAQYGFQTIEMKQGYMSRTRLRYGGSNFACSNASNWGVFNGANPAVYSLYDVTSQELITVGQEWWDPANPSHEVVRYDSYWLDTWKEPYMYAVTVDHTITGAMVAESFLATNDFWATRLGIYITAKGGAEDIHVAVCQVTAGVPDLNKVIAKTVLAHAAITVGWNTIPIQPSFLQKGTKYAVVIASNANHRIAMASGQSYVEGTFFYSTDGAYYQGDLTKDMLLQVWGAKFNAPQSTIEFQVINLDGGLRYIDILAEMWAPTSTALVWEIKPAGQDWQPLVRDNTTILASAPALVQFRARFDGTRDMQPALKLTGSRVHVSRPKTAFTHVSKQITLLSESQHIHVKVHLEAFDETPHDHACVIKTGPTNATSENPDTTTTKLIDATRKLYEREYVFDLAAAVTKFTIVQTGATNSAQNTYHVAERTYYAA